MADLLISPIFDFIFANLTSPAIEKMKQLWNIEEEVNSLSNTLSTIRAVLEDAEERQITTRVVKDWLRKLKDVAYDADDVLDDFATQAAQAKIDQQVPPESSSRSKKVKTFNFTSYFFSNKLVYKHEMASKMNEIRERLDKIEKDSHLFHFNTLSQGRTVEKIERPKTSSFVDGGVLGRDDDKKKIIEILMSDESNGNKFSVLPIIGMGGQGKTTLAQLVYNDKKIENLFEVRAWVCVSDNFDVLRITKEIIESVTKSHFESMAIEPTQRRLSELLIGKRFLIILDDVWSESIFDWERLRCPFSSGATGSKIIVTTRSEKVTHIFMGTTPPYILKRLSQVDSWSLFERIVFGDGNLGAQRTLIDIGKKIVHKCSGLPLAIKSLGGILYATREESVWENVLESKIWEQEGSNNETLPALRLSYQHLPANLKQCFAYCALFPKDFNFDKDELVKLWMGEGYIQPRRGMEMEKVGEQLFDDLVARSFFSRVSYHYRTVYNMHDLIHDLAEFVTKDDCLRIEAGEPIEAPMDIARHFLIIQDKQKIEQINMDDLYGCKSLLKIRTFIFRNLALVVPFLVQLGDLIDKFSCLRALSLSACGIKEVPYSIGNLIHLRYLNLSLNPIERLPDSICSLYNLQTLILNQCSWLIELPNATMDLINLRHLLMEGCGRLTCLPPKMGKLTRLRNLTMFIVGGDGSECTIAELKHLVNLGRNFVILGLENVANREEAEEADLKNKKNLESLMLMWGVDSVDQEMMLMWGVDREIFDDGQEEEVLEGLQPHINLKEITIDGYMGASLPSWLLQQNLLLTFTNLVRIVFSKCKKCQLLPPLWKLPSLKYLQLENMEGLERLEHQFCGVQGFPLLEVLSLKGLVNLEEWWGEEGGGDYLPSLRTLEVIGCPKLKSFPLHLSPALLKLTIRDCIELVVDQLRFPSLEKLIVLHSNASLLKSVPYLTSLKELSIREDDEVEYLDIQNLHSLHELLFSNCSKLSSFYPPANLEELYIGKCPNLEALRLDLHNLSSLNTLTLKDCPKVTSLLEKGLPASLTYLIVEDFPNLEALPLDLHNISSLKKLKVKECPKVASLPEKELPASLTVLSLEWCPNLEALPLDVHNLSSLQELTLVACPKVTSLPEKGLPASLTYLYLHSCPNLEALPLDLHNLSSLNKLILIDCPKVASLPEKGLPASLTYLNIEGCPLLTERCEKEKGEDWHKISHIPNLLIRYFSHDDEDLWFQEAER